VKRVLAFLFVVSALTAVSASAAGSSKINGWISDSMCGAKHAGTGAACVKKCIEGGMAPVFVDEANHVSVTAKADEAKKSVHIEAIAEAK
jgi:hypothetical protein